VPLSLNLGTLTSWNPLDHSRPATGLIYLFLPVVFNDTGSILGEYVNHRCYYLFFMFVSNNAILTFDIIPLLFFVIIELRINAVSGYTELLSNYFYIFEN